MLTLPLLIASATWSMPMLRDASCRGSSWIRTAYFDDPKTCTCATPSTVEMCCDKNVSAYSSRVASGRVLDDRARYRMGESAGFTFWYDGGMIPRGSWRSVFEIIACTSWAAASMLRSRLNCRVMLVLPSVEDDVIWSTPAMVVNCFSRGVATAEAIVSGLAPGSEALTETVG